MGYSNATYYVVAPAYGHEETATQAIHFPTFSDFSTSENYIEFNEPAAHVPFGLGAACAAEFRLYFETGFDPELNEAQRIMMADTNWQRFWSTPGAGSMEVDVQPGEPETADPMAPQALEAQDSRAKPVFDP